MSFRNKLITGTSSVLLLATMSASIPTYADDAGAFVGGIMAARIGSNMRARTQAEQEQAYYSRQNAQQQQPVQQAPAQQSAQQRLSELDKLAAGGYITADEYKRKKQSILDGM